MSVEITSREELEAWLDGKPREWMSSIACRSALREFPHVADPSKWGASGVNANVALAVFRCVALAIYIDADPLKRAAARFSAAENINTQMVRAPHNRRALESAFSAKDAILSAASNHRPFVLKHAVASISLNSHFYSHHGDESDLAWANVSSDCDAFQDGVEPAALKTRQLFAARPSTFEKSWASASRWLSRPEDGFSIWREWYYGRLEGLTHAFARFDDQADTEFYEEILKHSKNFWSRSPAKVNADITALVDSLRKPKDAVAYFISYTSKDEPAAREVADVLDELGKSYIVQYRDFKQRDFAVAMNDALSRSERIIPLYSKGYVRSDHCLTEWNHYYKLDPSFEDRKVVGFLLEPTDFPPLMDRVNYQSLMDLTGARRRIAIREWIDPSIPRTTRDWVRGVLMSTISPQIVHDNDNRLVLAPNPVFDEPEFPAELASALVELRMLLDLVRDQTFNLSSFMQRALRRYDETIEDAGADAHWGALDRMMAIVSDGLEQMREEEFSPGQRSTLSQIIAAHNNCMTSLRDPDLRARDTASIPAVNGDAADLSALVKGLEEISVELKNDDRTSEEFDAHVGDFINEGREFEYEASSMKEGDKASWAMRRYVLNVGGFGFGLLTALGSLASISATPAGRAALAAAQKLVDDFYRIIGL